MTPVEAVTPELIFQTALGFMAAKHLFVANDIGLFASLEQGACSLDELARRVNIPRRTLRIIADAMVALGFAEKHDGIYRNSAMASAFLSGAGPVDFRPFLQFWNHISWVKWGKLGESVRAGRGMAGRFAFADRWEEEIFSKGVEAWSAGHASYLPEAHDFSRYRRVLDLGGGTGSFLVPLLARYAELTAAVFELPAAAEVARRTLAATAFGSRISVVEGDFLRDPVPPGYDAVILANVVHTLSPEHVAACFQRVRQGSAKGARLLVIDLLTDASHTQPPSAALMAGEFLVITSEGDVYSTDEVQDWLQGAGWKVVACKPLADPVSLMVAEAV
jgi:SAM-dependent methyltransferase